MNDILNFNINIEARQIEMLILLFFTYSFLGWVMESIGGIANVKKFVNRGFLIGPYCPVYGSGVILITLYLERYKNDIPLVFILSMVICGVLEYITSYYMEILFNARWWDYSKKKFNINGRICLENLILFAIAGTIILCFTNPFLEEIYGRLPENVMKYITIGLCVIFFIDWIVSFRIILSFKGATYKEVDNTEEISNKVKDTAENVIMKAESEAIEFSRGIKLRGLKFQRKVRYTRNKLTQTGAYTLNQLLENANNHRIELSKKILSKKSEVSKQLMQKKAEYEILQKESIDMINNRIQKTKNGINELQKASKEKVDTTLQSIKSTSEEFTNRVKNNFRIKSIFNRRLMDAFPTMEVVINKKKKEEDKK